MSMTPRPVVAAYDAAAAYGVAPFHPPEAYPELGFLRGATQPGNTAYALFRNSLQEYDSVHFGSSRWNPLGGVITPGQRVVIKPNLVMHDRGEPLPLRAHGAIIRCVLDYAYLALDGRGTVTLCDAPIQGADFGRMVQQSGLDDVLAFYRSDLEFPVSLIDLRTEWARIDDRSGFICERTALPGDPAGTTLFDLGTHSELEAIAGRGGVLAVGDYSARSTNDNHQAGRHRYRISNTVLQADVVLSIAKMKTHQKAGITGALKNTVGMNTSKDYLPHFRMGAPPDGDEHPRSAFNWMVSTTRRRAQQRVPLVAWRLMRSSAEGVQRLLMRQPAGRARHGLLSGSWDGNDTIWRMVIDINRAVQYGALDGVLHDRPTRRFYYFVDGVVAGEGDGPLRPAAKPCGLLLHGSDPVAIDATMAILMGFSPGRIPHVREAFARTAWRLTEFDDFASVPLAIAPALASKIRDSSDFMFQPPRGWPALRASAPSDLLDQVVGSARVPTPSGAGVAGDRHER